MGGKGGGGEGLNEFRAAKEGCELEALSPSLQQINHIFSSDLNFTGTSLHLPIFPSARPMNQAGGSWSSNAFSFPPSSSSSSSISCQPQPPPPCPEISPYIQAIRSAGPQQVKKDLFEAVLRSDKAAKLATLMQLRREEDVGKEEKTRVFVECQRCEQEFDVDTYEDDCMYHSGESLSSSFEAEEEGEASFEPPSLSL